VVAVVANAACDARLEVMIHLVMCWRVLVAPEVSMLVPLPGHLASKLSSFTSMLLIYFCYECLLGIEMSLSFF